LSESNGLTFHPNGRPVIGLQKSVIEHPEWQAYVEGYVSTVLEDLTLLGCKNVSLSPRDNDPKQVRIATKRHGPSNTGYRYHVLTVRPPGAKSDSPGIDIGTMPRHVCRGHYQEYGPEFGKGLLFGRLSGRFFIPPYYKGKKENGIVEKDYEIAAL
jgi:hypothetical protein